MSMPVTEGNFWRHSSRRAMSEAPALLIWNMTSLSDALSGTPFGIGVVATLGSLPHAARTCSLTALDAVGVNEIRACCCASDLSSDAHPVAASMETAKTGITTRGSTRMDIPYAVAVPSTVLGKREGS